MAKGVLGILGAACLVLLVGVRVGAQGADDEPVKGMPRDEADLFAQMQKLARQRKEAMAIKNPVARKDATQALAAGLRDAVKELNGTLATKGVQGWVGRASVLPQYLHLTVKVKASKEVSATSLEFHIPHKGLSKDVLDAVKKLERGDTVVFSIAKDAKMPARARQTSDDVWIITDVPAALLTSLAPAEKK